MTEPTTDAARANAMNALLKVDPSKLKIENTPVVRGLPHGLYVPYFGVLSGDFAGRQFVIFHPRDDWEYTDFRLVVQAIGSAGFERAEIKNVVRYRDGGTTDIDSEIGNFHFPSPFNPPEDVATFNGERILVFENY